MQLYIIILVSLADGQGGSLESFGEIVAANEIVLNIGI